MYSADFLEAKTPANDLLAAAVLLRTLNINYLENLSKIAGDLEKSKEVLTTHFSLRGIYEELYIASLPDCNGHRKQDIPNKIMIAVSRLITAATNAIEEDKNVKESLRQSILANNLLVDTIGSILYRKNLNQDPNTDHLIEMFKECARSNYAKHMEQ